MLFCFYTNYKFLIKTIIIDIPRFPDKMSFKSIMIHNVKPEYTAKYIANIMLTSEIAKISSITLIPQMTNTNITNVAYIDIDTYCDTEEAYRFINKLKSGPLAFYHDNNKSHDDVWVFDINTHNSGGLCVGPYTTNIYYDENETNTDHNNDSTVSNCDEELEDLERQRPIQGIGFDRYSVDEALVHLHFLHEKFNACQCEFKQEQIQEEIIHINNELRIQYTMENSSNVTLRAYQNSKKNKFQENQNLSDLSMLRTNLFRTVSDLSV